ncbi:hypothetical protein C8Q76DRAFT_696334 [Earliella scabrosa]|nr:hypothetical protein C8Q76DRAFT_696334 [Earliella scabrosa]
MESTAAPDPALPDRLSINSAQQVKWSARHEILLIVWRIGEALRALPPDPDSATVRRWNHGIARELWHAIIATGLEASMRVVTGETSAARRSLLLDKLLLHTEWKWDRSMRFNLSTFDIDGYQQELGRLRDNRAIADVDAVWSRPKWWRWGPEGPEGVRAPSWWCTPSEYVSHPMPVHGSDLADLNHDYEDLDEAMKEMVLDRKVVLDVTREELARIEQFMERNP